MPASSCPPEPYQHTAPPGTQRRYDTIGCIRRIRHSVQKGQCCRFRFIFRPPCVSSTSRRNTWKHPFCEGQPTPREAKLFESSPHRHCHHHHLTILTKRQGRAPTVGPSTVQQHTNRYRPYHLRYGMPTDLVCTIYSMAC